MISGHYWVINIELSVRLTERRVLLHIIDLDTCIKEDTRLGAVGRLGTIRSWNTTVKCCMLILSRRYVHEVLSGAQIAYELLPTPFIAELLILLRAHLFYHYAAFLLVWTHADRFLSSFIEIAQAVFSWRQIVPLCIHQTVSVSLWFASDDAIHTIPGLLIECIFVMSTLLFRIQLLLHYKAFTRILRVWFVLFTDLLLEAILKAIVSTCLLYTSDAADE